MHLHRLRFRFRRGLCYLCRGFLYGLLRHSVGFFRHPGRCFLRLFRRAVGFRLALRFQYLVHREFVLIVHGFGSFLFRLSPWP